MRDAQDRNSVIATTRFGLGSRPGEIEAARADPKRYLKDQIGKAQQPAGALGSGEERILAFRNNYDFQAAERAAAAAASATSGKPLVGGPRGEEDRYRFYAATTLDELEARTHLAVKTNAAFAERWSLFWTNHFSVSQIRPEVAALAGVFEREAIRPNVFGKFSVMLAAVAQHPAMLNYADQVQVVGPNSVIGRDPYVTLPANMYRPVAIKTLKSELPINLNRPVLKSELARIILDYHTVGQGAHTALDAEELALALTGWGYGANEDRTGAFIFRTAQHEPGARTVLGKTYPEGDLVQGQAILKDLAVHPATAKRLARKIAAHFVGDSPPASLTAKLETAYEESGGDLSRVAHALVDAPESWTAAPAKIKTPYEMVVSTCRAFDFEPYGAQELWNVLFVMGQKPYGPPGPAGWSDKATAWGEPDSIVKRLAWVESFAEAATALPRDPGEVARSCLGASMSKATQAAIDGASSPAEAITLFLMSPEFLRR